MHLVGMRQIRSAIQSQRPKLTQRTCESLSSTARALPRAVSSIVSGITSDGLPANSVGAWLNRSPERESISNATVFSTCTRNAIRDQWLTAARLGPAEDSPRRRLNLRSRRSEVGVLSLRDE